MISEEICNEILCYLKLNVHTVSITLFEELLDMRDKMITFNEYVPKGRESVTALLMEEILQTFLEELLNKVNISKNKEV